MRGSGLEKFLKQRRTMAKLPGVHPGSIGKPTLGSCMSYKFPVFDKNDPDLEQKINEFLRSEIEIEYKGVPIKPKLVNDIKNSLDRLTWELAEQGILCDVPFVKIKNDSVHFSARFVSYKSISNPTKVKKITRPSNLTRPEAPWKIEK
jgi:hypothetical protein